ncbi:hypothetical protein Skr01_48360 [Sphaerisporangium krabiense]|uniref:Nucleotidyltransferase domain-containing protein n=1 Tax=Sphaerisporangium krabiense TaxID=763782 RepID=A0A7W8Z2G6_9ACTN|nr:hypothetical protein [Sphaerisporangium krabiense]MBB5625948.1 hypothetical protein [Sphaerisporangium krabiense]GII64751.1 hypothetical protein Skr01_48360 [Sphaerisporangium krabiense]
MKIGEARAVAARWVAGHRVPGFAGAYISGSVAWAPVDAELPATSDVDVVIVVRGEVPPKLGKFRHEGLLLEVSYAPSQPAEQVLASPALAPGLSRGVLVSDPDGSLAALHAAVARDFAHPRWVRARCAALEARIETLAGLDTGRPLAARALAWAFPASLPTLVVLTAAGVNPTVRRRYVAAREVLASHGRAGFHEELLAWLGCENLSRSRVAAHLERLADVYDRVPYDPARPYGSDLTPEARHISIDGTRELVDQGLHREATWWIVVTFARCLTFAPHGAAALEELLDDLGVGTPETMRHRARAALAGLPRLRRVRETLLTRSGRTGVSDGR